VIRRVAEHLGRPVKTVYWSLARLRQALLHCIEQSLAAEDCP
jgi:DNA-directed RNA polymerase specialized sigma24 family protein